MIHQKLSNSSKHKEPQKKQFLIEVIYDHGNTYEEVVIIIVIHEQKPINTRVSMRMREKLF